MWCSFIHASNDWWNSMFHHDTYILVDEWNLVAQASNTVLQVFKMVHHFCMIWGRKYVEWLCKISEVEKLPRMFHITWTVSWVLVKWLHGSISLICCTLSANADDTSYDIRLEGHSHMLEALVHMNWFSGMAIFIINLAMQINSVLGYIIYWLTHALLMHWEPAIISIRHFP